MNRNDIYKFSRVFSICLALILISKLNAAEANQLPGAKWVPVAVDDITIVIPVPFKVGRPDLGSDCLQLGISDAVKFACTFLTLNIWHNANNSGNLRLPYVEYNAEYLPGIPYDGPLLRGEAGTPNWYPVFGNDGYIDHFRRYYNGGYQDRYVPWSPALVDTSCQHALDFDNLHYNTV